MQAWRQKRVCRRDLETLLRISTGIEDGEDLIADLENGFGLQTRGKMSGLRRQGRKVVNCINLRAVVWLMKCYLVSRALWRSISLTI